MHKIPAIFCWSGGKDSAYALHKIQQEGKYTIKYLLSTINGNNHRLSMHGIYENLIQQQADNIGIELIKVYVYEANNIEYEKQMATVLNKAKTENIFNIIYGDIFLEDLRQYREDKMNTIGFACVFPLWKIDTTWLINDFITKGFKTYTCCINDGYLNENWVGKIIDDEFVQQLPNTVDPCGENGEYHSFCYDGPIYKTPLSITLGAKLYQPLVFTAFKHPTPIKDVGTKGFWFIEIESSIKI
jgi:uncharacterized protein (TIGR00290 family)